MNDRIEIPNSVIGAVADILGSYYYSHTRLNTLFMESGAPGDPPEGNCVNKCVLWLRRCNQDSSVNPIEILGTVIQDFMDREFDELDERWPLEQKRIRKVLARNGLTYQLNGVVLKSGASPSSKTLAEILRSGDFAAIDAEFERALTSVETDPPSGITAASSLIEAICKTYIEDHNLQLPQKQNIRDLWRVVRDDLGFNPASITDDDLKRILSGLSSIVDGVGSLRTHAGSAHGRGPHSPILGAREARLAINAAHSLSVFIMEVWASKSQMQGSV